MTWKQLLIGVGAAALVAGSGLIWSWQPERQVRRNLQRLVADLEDRKWEKVKARISPAYEDEWGLRRDDLMRLTHEVLRQFFWVEITPVEPRLVRTAAGVELESRFRLAGRGTALAEHALSRAAELREPFVLAWRKESWKPWDWKLASVRQPEIYLQASPWE